MGEPESVVEAVEQHIAADGEVVVEEPARIRWMTRPAPVPEGSIAVELPRLKNEGWFLVVLDGSCASCSGDGRNHEPPVKNPPPDYVRLNYCRVCILDPVEAFTKEYNRRARARREEYEAAEKAERADTGLAARLQEAKDRVADLERQRDEALGENKGLREKSLAEIESAKADAVRFAGQADEYAKRFAEAMRGFRDDQKAAKAEHDKIIAAEKERYAKQSDEIERQRLQRVADDARCREELAACVKASASLAKAAETTLAWAEAGPEKIAKRFEERLKKPRETLERLQKRYES